MRALVVFVLTLAAALAAASGDEFQTSEGPLKITPIAHATLVIEAGGQTLYVDPVGQGNYDGLPQADVILVTHSHGDHLAPDKIAELSKRGTTVVVPPSAAEKVNGAQSVGNGETTTIGPWRIEAVPMYNIERGPAPGRLYHNKGDGNGYVLTYGGLRIYIAGDTEGIPEMRALEDIDVALVPMNLPYTMTPEEAADAVKAFKPDVVYPYHYRGADLDVFEKALAGTGVEVRRREWYP